MKKVSYDEMKKDLKNKLPKKRYIHSLGVMYTAIAMAMNEQMDIEPVRLSGLLHDCAKWLNDEEKIVKCKEYHINPTVAENNNKELLHAKIGAYLARDVYGITNDSILNAIRYHTTGRPNMTDLEEIIYIADYIEPNRKPLPNIEEIRYLAFHNRKKCIVKIIENTLSYLEDGNTVIDDTTMDTYKWYQSQI